MTRLLLFLTAALVMLSGRVHADSGELRKVSVQLKWYHQFQFAGIYTAKERGYYTDAGLDVEIKPFSEGVDSIQDVSSGKSDFGIAGPEILLERLNGARVAVVTPIFQHSPSVIMSLKSTGINSIHDLAGRKVVLGNNPIFKALFRNEGIENKIIISEQNWDLNRLTSGEVDAMEAYITNTPYSLMKKGIQLNFINPATYGIDFYGDVIFCSEDTMRKDYDTVKAFREATIKGWEYSLDNIEETVDLIINKYHPDKTREHLLFEANSITNIIVPELVQIGHTNIGRWRHMAEVYSDLGMTSSQQDLAGFFFEDYSQENQHHLGKLMIVVGAGFALFSIASLILLLFNMKLKKSVEKQTYELKKEIAVRQNTESELLLYKRVFEYALEGITITNADGTIVALNKSFENITGYSDEDVIGQSPRILKSGIHNKEFYTQMWKDLFDNGAWSGEIWNRKKSGEAFPQHLSIAAVKDTDDNISNFIAVFHDITDFKANEEKIKFQAYHDALTGLPNRLLINDRLRHAITHTERIGKKLAVIFLDLDNFKRINDTMGHLTGDKLLKCTADRLSRMMRAEDTVGRLGGDEFVIIVEDVSTNNFIVRMAERILGSFAALFEIDSKEIYVSASIGITYYPDDGSDPETLIKNADIAMYDAKESGKNRFKFFTSALNDEVVKKHNLDQRIRKAIDNDEFVAYFQPRVSLETGRPVAMETLARWVTEDGSIVSPADFIPVLEENGLIYELCRSMLIQTCEFLMRIRNELGIITKASVNLSPKQLDKPEIVDCIADLIKSFGVEPGQIEMEITENDVMRDTPKTVAIFNKLMENSISVYIDDFGTGYSSLHYLKLFPIRGLKIDRSFIRDMLEDKSDEAITRTMIIFSQTFGIEAIAEGVETKEQAEALRDMGCREVQGFYFAGPMPAEDYISYLESVFQDRA